MGTMVTKGVNCNIQMDPDPKVRERNSYRQSLLTGYTSTVPIVLKKLPTQPEHQRGDTLKITGMCKCPQCSR